MVFKVLISKLVRKSYFQLIYWIYVTFEPCFVFTVVNSEFILKERLDKTIPSSFKTESDNKNNIELAYHCPNCYITIKVWTFKLTDLVTSQWLVDDEEQTHNPPIIS